MRTKWLWIALLLAIQPWLAASAIAAAVEAQVDRNTIAPGESVLLRVIVTDGQGEVDLSGLTDFKVVPQGTSSSVQIVNTRMTRQTAHNYLLIPQKKGNLTIPALTIELDGKPYHTQPITIQVTTDPQAAGSETNRKVWVEADVSHRDPFVGQQIIYTFRFFNAVNVSDAKFQPPEFSDFKAKELEDRRSVRKVIDGREVMVTEINFILTPLAEGAARIEPALLQVGLIKPDRRRRRSVFDDFFDDPFFRSNQVVTRNLQTEALDLRVRPLPPLDPGKRFSGLVGQFELATEMEKTDLRVGDSATLTVTIQGHGNIMDAQAPRLQATGDFKAYADSPQEEITTGRDGSSGRKLFRTALVPIKPGRFQLPPVRLTYFDTQAEAYRTLTGVIPELMVQAADTAQAEPIVITPHHLPDIQKQVTFTHRDILPPKDSLDALHSHGQLDLKLFLLCLIGPMLAYGALAAALNRRHSDPTPAERMRARATRGLKSAAQSPPEQALTYLYQALTAAILGTAGRVGEALTWQEAKALLQAGGQPDDTAQQAADLLAEIESLKYSGAGLSQEQLSDLLARTRPLVKELTA
jgi:hypothetical protein